MMLIRDGVIVLVVAVLGASFADAHAGTYSLSKIDSAKLAMYRANNEPVVVLTVAAQSGASDRVAALAEQLGGRVGYRHDRIDFLAVVLPREKVASFVNSAPIDAIDVDNLGGSFNSSLGHFSMSAAGTGAGVSRANASGDPKTAGSETLSDAWPPKLGAYNLDHPYNILQDLDGEAFRKRAPGNDGRGVVIAHVEWFPDFLSPELQVAYDAQGREIPKFADVINIAAVSRSLDPNAPREGAMWTTRLSPAQTTRTTQLTSSGQRYRVPKAGTYRLAKFGIEEGGDWSLYVYPLLAKHHGPTRERDERQKKEPPKNDKDETADAARNVLLFDVLWSDATGTAWIDQDGDKDFSDELGVRDFRASHQFGVLGQDDPTTDLRETIGYSVQSDGDYLAINVGFGGHASIVAGAAAANRGPTGRIDGVAPGAQLIAINCNSNDTPSGYARSLVAAFTHPLTDLVLIEGHYEITGAHYNLYDGRSALALVLARLTRTYRKPAFMTAGNDPGMTTIMDTTVPPEVISVGAYQSAASVFASQAVRTRYGDDLHWVGSEGPSGAGSLKPDLLAPANPMTLQPRFRMDPGSYRVDGIFQLPPGYEIGGGTSTATPVAAGAAALLVGAAKREGLPHDAEAIHRVFRNSARFMPRLPAYKQGRGVIQLDAAWKQLQTRQVETLDEIEVAAPVRTASSSRLTPADVGTGLFEREGWRAGDRASREITLTRKSGPPMPLAYTLSWEGEQAAFSTPQSVTLPLGEPVRLPVTIAVNEAGVHSSILHLQRAGVAAPSVSIPVTVVVPRDFAADANYVVDETFELDRPGRRNVFVRVPAYAQALSVTVKAPRDKIFALLQTPDNRIVRRVEVTKEGYGTITLDEPIAGVWQIIVLNYFDAVSFDWAVPRGEVLPSIPVTVSAGVMQVEVNARDGVVSFKNLKADFIGGAVRSALGGRRSESRSIAQGDMLEYDLDIEEGTEQLIAQVDRISGSDLDVDLHLLDCTAEDECSVVRRATWNESRERAIVERPAAGKWKVLIVASGSGQATVSYSDIYTHPKLGALHVTDVQKMRKPADVWDAQMNVWRAASPKAGYEPVGLLWVHAKDHRVFRGDVVATTSGYELPLGLTILPID